MIINILNQITTSHLIINNKYNIYIHSATSNTSHYSITKMRLKTMQMHVVPLEQNSHLKNLICQLIEASNKAQPLAQNSHLKILPIQAISKNAMYMTHHECNVNTQSTTSQNTSQTTTSQSSQNKNISVISNNNISIIKTTTFQSSQTTTSHKHLIYSIS